MKARLLLYGLILGIPLVAFAVAEGIQARLNSALRAGFRQNNPNADPAIVSKISIDRLCQDSKLTTDELCVYNSNLNLMSNAALAAGTSSIALLLVIRLAGIISRNSRSLLLFLFKPGLYFTVSILIFMVLINAALAMSAIYYGESHFIGRIHVYVIGLIGIGAVSGVFAISKRAFSIIKKAQANVIGIQISRQDAPKLWDLVDQLSEKIGSLRPQNIIIGLDPIFFVTEAEVSCLSGVLSGRTLYCSLSLSRVLSTTEFSSIIGHELCHFKGLDTQYSARFYPIYRGTTSVIATLLEAGGEGTASIALLPAVAFLSYFLECFAIAESRISRARELAADGVGTIVTNTASFSSALVKVHAYSGLWRGFQEAAMHALEKGERFTNFSKTYAESIVNEASVKSFKGISKTRIAHPTDSHPPLATRLEALKMTIEAVTDSALNVNPGDPAILLIESPEYKEEKISAAYQSYLAGRIGIDLDDVHKETE